MEPDVRFAPSTVNKQKQELSFDSMINLAAVNVGGKVVRTLTGLTTPVGWLLLLQLTVLSRSAIVV